MQQLHKLTVHGKSAYHKRVSNRYKDISLCQNTLNCIFTDHICLFQNLQNIKNWLKLILITQLIWQDFWVVSIAINSHLAVLDKRMLIQFYNLSIHAVTKYILTAEFMKSFYLNLFLTFCKEIVLFGKEADLYSK